MQLQESKDELGRTRFTWVRRFPVGDDWKGIWGSPGI